MVSYVTPRVVPRSFYSRNKSNILTKKKKEFPQGKQKGFTKPGFSFSQYFLIKNKSNSLRVGNPLQKKNKGTTVQVQKHIRKVKVANKNFNKNPSKPALIQGLFTFRLSLALKYLSLRLIFGFATESYRRSSKMHSSHLLLEEPIRMASILEPSKPVSNRRSSTPCSFL